MGENLGKIRKRGCYSSSSSSLARKYKLKRAILVGKQTRSPVSAQTVGEAVGILKFPTGTDGVVSARRLAATLWEINHVSSPPTRMNEEVVEMHSSDPDALPEVIGSGFDGGQRRKSAPESRKLLVPAGGDELFGNGGRLTEMQKLPEFKDLRKGLATAKELLKALSHICGRHSSAANSLVSALHVELDKASVQVDQLYYDRRSYRKEMRYAMQHLAEEKVKRVLELAGAELEAERKVRRQTERINKKLGKELADKNAKLDIAVKELEHVCEDRAEEVKRASAEALEEVEMLQLADVLREERMQMKLAEAKYHFEEKNADIEKLRSELEAYMSKNIVSKDDDSLHEGEESPGSANSDVLRDFLQKTLGKVCQNPNIENLDSSSESDMHSIELELDCSKKSFKWGYSPPAQQDDSKRSSVEVFKGRKSLSEKIQWATISLLKGGGSTTKTDNATSTSTPTPPPLQPQNNETQDMFQKQRPSSSGSHRGTKEHVDENQLKEHKSVKSLKKKILSSFKMGSSQRYTSPAKQWAQAI